MQQNKSCKVPFHKDTCVFSVCFQLLATVLSQSAKAKEHLLEQSKSVDQPPGRTRKGKNTPVIVLLLMSLLWVLDNEFTETILVSVMKLVRLRMRGREGFLNREITLKNTEQEIGVKKTRVLFHWSFKKMSSCHFCTHTHTYTCTHTHTYTQILAGFTDRWQAQRM